MATNFGYVERTADSYVNWAEISKDMTETLYQVEKTRNDKKAAIDKATKESLDFVKNNPVGEDRTVNAESLELANKAANTLLEAERKMKSGLLSPTDYMKIREKIHGDTKDAFESAKLYQEFFAERQKRYREKASSRMELNNLSRVEGFADFTKSGFFINPYTGAVMLAKKEKKIVDGKEVYVMASNPTDVTSVRAMLNMIRTKYDRYDYDKATSEFVKANGKDQRTSVEKGRFIKTVSDITQKSYTKVDAEMEKDLTAEVSKIQTELSSAKTQKEKDEIKARLKVAQSALSDYKTKGSIYYEYEKAEDGYAKAMIGDDPNTKISLLLDTGIMASNGKVYDTTDNPEEAKNNPNLILVKTNGDGTQEFEFTEEQDKAALDFMLSQMRRKYDYSETQTQMSIESSQRPTPEEGKDNKIRNQIAENWAKALMESDPQEKQTALNALVGATSKSEGVYQIDLDENKATFYKQDASGNKSQFTVDLKDPNNNPYTLKNAITLASGIGGESESVPALKRAGRYSGMGGNKVGGFNGRTFTAKINITTPESQYQGGTTGQSQPPFYTLPGQGQQTGGGAFKGQ